MKLSQNKETLDQIAPLVEYAFLKNNDIREDPNFSSRYNIVWVLVNIRITILLAILW